MCCPAARFAMLVLRQNRSFPSAAGTWIERLPGLSVRSPFTINSAPVTEFSGRPPSSGATLASIPPSPGPGWRIKRVYRPRQRRR